MDTCLKKMLNAAFQAQETLLRKENKPFCSVLHLHTESAAVISEKSTQRDSVKSFVFKIYQWRTSVEEAADGLYGRD